MQLRKLFLPLLWLFERRRRMQPTTALIIDCGSGFTRAAVFSRDADGLIRSCEAHSHVARGGGYGELDAWRQRKVVDALVEGGAALREWAASIQTLIDATGCAKTVVGTTGGLRQAVADGLVTPAMVAALVALLRELAPSATVRLLSGDDEARAELAAVQYAADATLPAAAARPVGMLSGGGMSCQVGWHERGCKGPTFLSVTAALNPHSHALKAQCDTECDTEAGLGADTRRVALEAFQANLAAEVEAIVSLAIVSIAIVSLAIVSLATWPGPHRSMSMYPRSRRRGGAAS